MSDGRMVCLALWRTTGLALLVWGAVGASGCKRTATPGNYEVLSGTVEGLRADTFELTLRPEPWPGWTKKSTIACLMTEATEIYVNDRFSDFSAIAIGDGVELIGYPEAGSRRAERFVVSFAYITRNEPLPPEPDLSPAATQPTSQPEE